MICCVSQNVSERPCPQVVRQLLLILRLPPFFQEGNNSASHLLQQCLDSGISQVSVGLITWDEDQYQELMQPLLPPRCNIAAHKLVCEFIQTAVQLEGMDVEITAVDRDDVDKEKTEALSRSLGVTTPIRWRPYFP
mmetsp:Transcript_3071/g.5313  ORF Transcript_3071/g.5313 Transcript_3071/m.5313 type:complete len:136 (+) Transcript_3071:183-590(+)